MKSATIAIMLLVMMLVFPTQASQIYSNEYYSLGNESWKVAGARVNDFGQYFGIYSELRRQNILIERQNDLLAELTGVMVNQSKQTSALPAAKWKCTGGGTNYCNEWVAMSS